MKKAQQPKNLVLEALEYNRPNTGEYRVLISSNLQGSDPVLYEAIFTLVGVSVKLLSVGTNYPYIESNPNTRLFARVANRMYVQKDVADIAKAKQELIDHVGLDVIDFAYETLLSAFKKDF